MTTHHQSSQFSPSFLAASSLCGLALLPLRPTFLLLNSSVKFLTGGLELVLLTLRSSLFILSHAGS